MTAPAHVLVLRPIIERLRRRGHEVTVTSRSTRRPSSYSSCTASSTPRSAATAAPRECASSARCARTGGMRALRGRGGDFDLAIAHGSNDLAIASRLLGVPEANMHDYEFAVTQHRVGCRLAKRVIFPEAVPPSGCAGSASPRRSCFSTRGSRRSTTWRTSSRTRGSSSGEGGYLASSRRRPASARRLALSPQVEPAVSPGARSRRQRGGRACRSAAPNRRAAEVRECARLPL